MKKLTIDTGIQEFEINGGGVLRFNPSDPNVYHRFFALTQEIGRIDEELQQEVAALPEGDGQGGLRALQNADAKAKALLNEVFGLHNDFDRILDGVNVMAVGANGQRVIVNLFEALAPLFEAGAKRCADAKLAAARKARAQRRAATGQ